MTKHNFNTAAPKKQDKLHTYYIELAYSFSDRHLKNTSFVNLKFENNFKEWIVSQTKCAPELNLCNPKGGDKAYFSLTCTAALAKKIKKNFSNEIKIMTRDEKDLSCNSEIRPTTSFPPSHVWIGDGYRRNPYF